MRGCGSYIKWLARLDAMCAREAGGAARGKSKLTYNSHTGNF